MILQNIQKPIPVGQKHLATIKLDENKEKRIGNFENLTKIWIKTQTDRKVQSSHLLRLIRPEGTQCPGSRIQPKSSI